MSVSAYPAYWDSGVPWLGNIPTGWSVGRIKNIFEIRKRIAGEVGPDVLSITQSGLRVKDVESNEGQQAMDYSKYQRVLPGEFAMNHMDLLTGWIDIAEQEGVTSPDYRVFGAREADAVDCQYFLRVFQMAYSERQFYPFGQGSSQLGRWRLPKDEFYDFPVPVPPVEEQQRIRAFLDCETAKIDTLVAEQARLIALLKEKRQAVISHAVSKGLDPGAPMKESGIEWLGEIPSHWETFALKRGVKLTAGYAFPSDAFCDQGIPVVRIGDIMSDGTVPMTSPKYLPIEYSERHNQYLVSDGDAVMAMTGATVGKAGRYRCNYPSLLNQRVCKMAGHGQIDHSFMLQILESSAFKEHIQLHAIGGAQPNISETGILNFVAAIPPIREQQEIVDYLTLTLKDFGNLEASAQYAIELLQERRTALISAAVTGKVDVRGLVEQHEMEAA